MRDIVLITGEAARYDYVDDLDFLSSFSVSEGIAAGHYTRPSLSSIHSGSYLGAVQTKPVNPTLGEVLADAGYNCIGLTTNPQADESFGFDAGYQLYDNYTDAGTRGSWPREFLARFSVVQYIYQRLFSLHSRRENRPSDREIIDRAIGAFNEMDSPRFLWIHLMESHRPYGLGDDGISPELNRKAKFSPGKITDQKQVEIRSAYQNALDRVDRNIEHLLDSVDSDPLFAFSGDHGELLGENGAYFHPPHEKRTDDELLRVPVVLDGIDVVSDTVSLIDIAPTLVSAVGIDPPSIWQGRNVAEETRQSALTIIPWQNDADVLWHEGDHRIHGFGGSVKFDTGDEQGERTELEKSGEVEQRLRDFGYLE